MVSCFFQFEGRSETIESKGSIDDSAGVASPTSSTPARSPTPRETRERVPAVAPARPAPRQQQPAAQAPVQQAVRRASSNHALVPDISREHNDDYSNHIAVTSLRNGSYLVRADLESAGILNALNDDISSKTSKTGQRSYKRRSFASHLPDLTLRRALDNRALAVVVVSRSEPRVAKGGKRDYSMHMSVWDGCVSVRLDMVTVWVPDDQQPQSRATLELLRNVRVGDIIIVLPGAVKNLPEPVVTLEVASDRPSGHLDYHEERFCYSIARSEGSKLVHYKPGTDMGSVLQQLEDAGCSTTDCNRQVLDDLSKLSEYTKEKLVAICGQRSVVR